MGDAGVLGLRDAHPPPHSPTTSAYFHYCTRTPVESKVKKPREAEFLPATHDINPSKTTLFHPSSLHLCSEKCVSTDFRLEVRTRAWVRIWASYTCLLCDPVWVSVSSSVKWKGRADGVGTLPGTVGESAAHRCFQACWAHTAIFPLPVLIGVYNWENAVARVPLSQRSSLFMFVSEVSGLCKVQELLAGFYPCLKKGQPADKSSCPGFVLCI